MFVCMYDVCVKERKREINWGEYEYGKERKEMSNFGGRLIWI